jgi:hypothetical protein
MTMWVQIRGHDDDDEYPATATYEILAGGVLKVISGSEIRLYSPAHWQEVLIDSRPTSERDERAQETDADLRWQ